MNAFLTYLFWPNPGNAGYDSPKAMLLLVACALLLVAAALLSVWRRRLAHPRLKRLSRSWAAASFWFGLTGVLLVIARVEMIQFVAMRVWWLLWIAAAVSYVVFQVRSFRVRYYEEIPLEKAEDPRRAYLPKKKRR